MKLLPNSVTRTVSRQMLHVQKASPKLLFVAGVVGFGVTVVTASRATLKLDKVMHEHRTSLIDINAVMHDDYTERDRNHDKTVVYVRTGLALIKLYAPAIAVGSLSIAALTGSHHILNKRNAGLTAAYASVEKAFEEYRARVRKEYGEDKDTEFRYGMEDHTIVEETSKGVKKKVVKRPTGESMYAKWFDKKTRNWQPTAAYNQAFIQAQQNYANDMLIARGHVFLNDVYDWLGLERTSAGSQVGWVLNNKRGGDNFIDFDMFHERNENFINHRENRILLDFNVDGVVWDLLDEMADTRV